MIKTVVFKLEGVLLNEELLYFKYYEILWRYLRKDPKWEDFEQLLRYREYLISRAGHDLPYLSIGRSYLSQRDYQKFKKEIEIFTRKYHYYYLKLIPGMRTILQTTSYYYINALFTHRNDLLKISMDQFRLDRYFPHFTVTKNKKDKTASFNSLQKIMEDTHSKPEEVVLVSNRLDTEIPSANRLGMLTIHADFSIKTKGILPQSITEKQYFESLESSPHLLFEPLKRASGPDAVADKPGDINKLLQEFESEEKNVSTKGETKIDFWDIAREMLMPEYQKGEKS